ncbi:hypothetical protein ACFX13_043078 [Malus domestica]
MMMSLSGVTEANAKPREDDDEPKEGEIVGNQDSASSKPSKGIAPQSHALEHSWTFWFNSPAAKSAKSKQEDWGSSIGPIYTFITVEEFWRTNLAIFWWWKNPHRRRKKPRTHRRALREEEEAGLSKSHGLGSASLRTFKEASSPHESPLVPLNLVPSPIKHETVVQSSPVPPKERRGQRDSPPLPWYATRHTPHATPPHPSPPPHPFVYLAASLPFVATAVSSGSFSS